MGLDMYLTARRFVDIDEDDKVKHAAIVALFPDLVGKQHTIQSVVIQAAEWNKCNAVHGWFVDNVQNGADDCGKYSVSREELEKLRDLCRLVIAKPKQARKLLPAREGFFFGSYDYDEDYFEDLEYTVSALNEALALPEEWAFSYSSSW